MLLPTSRAEVRRVAFLVFPRRMTPCDALVVMGEAGASDSSTCVDAEQGGGDLLCSDRENDVRGRGLPSAGDRGRGIQEIAPQEGKSHGAVATARAEAPRLSLAAALADYSNPRESTRPLRRSLNENAPDRKAGERVSFCCCMLSR